MSQLLHGAGVMTKKQKSPRVRSAVNSRDNFLGFMQKHRIQKLRSNALIEVPGGYREVRGDDRKDAS